MLKAMDVANYFIDVGVLLGQDDMTNMRVNKLLYFAQGRHLAKTGKPLFDEDIEAWKYGPVVKNVYQTLKENKDKNISAPYGEYSIEIFTPEQRQILLEVVSKYNRLVTSYLVALSHAAGSPWDLAFSSGNDNTIQKEDLKKYFTDCMDTDSDNECPPSDIGETYFDEDGYTVFPKEWDDGDW